MTWSAVVAAARTAATLAVAVSVAVGLAEDFAALRAVTAPAAVGLAEDFAALRAVTAPAVASASELGLSGREGHPRDRFPLTLHLPVTGDAALDATARRAVSDWNALAETTIGRQVFADAARADGAQVVVALDRSGSRLMGEARVDVGPDGIIIPPVRVLVFELAARGQTSRQALFYQVLAHELGHALGLAHVREPRSVMCCIEGSIDFKDPAQRQAYVEARRRPDLASVRAQLIEHYDRFWSARR